MTCISTSGKIELRRSEFSQILGWHVSSECFFSFSITTLFFKKDMQHQSTIYIHVCFFSFSFCYMYFFRCFISFHFITIHSFLFSQGQKNIDIDLFCSYCVIIYPLRNNIFILRHPTIIYSDPFVTICATNTMKTSVR
jgi:hypothetical protein